MLQMLARSQLWELFCWHQEAIYDHVHVSDVMLCLTRMTFSRFFRRRRCSCLLEEVLRAWLRINGLPTAGLRETWEDGRAFKELAQRRAAVADAREGIEAARKVGHHCNANCPPPCMRAPGGCLAELTLPEACGKEGRAKHRMEVMRKKVVVLLQAMRKKLPPPENTLSQAGPSQASQQTDYLSPEDYVAQDEIFKVRLAALKREEDGLQREKERLEVEKERHFRCTLISVACSLGSKQPGGRSLSLRYLHLMCAHHGVPRWCTPFSRLHHI